MDYEIILLWLKENWLVVVLSLVAILGVIGFYIFHTRSKRPIGSGGDSDDIEHTDNE